MLRYLHQLSALFFYVLGSSFFLAYLFLRNELWPVASALWLQAADIPFALAALLYGGLSLYFSLEVPGRKQAVLAWGIGVPLGVLFLLLVTLNFWGIF